MRRPRKARTGRGPRRRCRPRRKARSLQELSTLLSWLTILFRRVASLCATAYIPGGAVRLILPHAEPAQREASAGREQRAGRAAAGDLPPPALRPGAGRARVRRGALRARRADSRSVFSDRRPG